MPEFNQDIYNGPIGKQVDINKLLNTKTWIETDTDDTSNASLGFALSELKRSGAVAVKTHTPNYGKIWVVKLANDYVNNVELQELASLINEKTYVLNRHLNNSFIWPELENNNNNNKIQIRPLVGGGSNKTNIKGELIAIKNTIKMNGGNNLKQAQINNMTQNKIAKELRKGNLKLSPEDGERLKVLFKKVLKYQERINMIVAYLEQYNKIDGNKGKDVKEVVDKYESQERKLERASSNLNSFIDNLTTDEKEYYTVKPKTMSLQEFNYDNLEPVFDKQFALIEDREKKTKLESANRSLGREKERNTQAERELGDSRRTLDERNKELNITKENLVKVTSDLAESQDEVSVASAEIEQLTQDLEVAQTEALKQRADIDALEKQISENPDPSVVTDLRTQLAEAKSNFNAERVKVGKLETRLARQQGRIKTLQGTILKKTSDDERRDDDKRAEAARKARQARNVRNQRKMANKRMMRKKGR